MNHIRIWNSKLKPSDARKRTVSNPRYLSMSEPNENDELLQTSTDYNGWISRKFNKSEIRYFKYQLQPRTLPDTVWPFRTSWKSPQAKITVSSFLYLWTRINIKCCSFNPYFLEENLADYPISSSDEFHAAIPTNCFPNFDQI